MLRPPTAPVTDPFGRLVGEVVRADDRASLNVALVAAGLGTPDERYAHEDPDLAERARAAVAGAPDRAAGSDCYTSIARRRLCRRFR